MESTLYLKRHDSIAFVCPSNFLIDPHELEITKEYFQKHHQLKVVCGQDTAETLPPQLRAEIFLNHLFNSKIKLISQMRGIEGTADIIPYIHIHHEAIQKLSPKLLLGYSDYSALLLYFSQMYHWPVIHGPSCRQIALKSIDSKTRHATEHLLFGDCHLSVVDQLKPLNDAACKDKKIVAELNGGNLSLIEISINDVWHFDAHNKIVFFENCGQKGFQIDRSLKHFSRIGLLDQIKAMILGDFTSYPIGNSKQEQQANKNAILKSLSGFADHHDFPVLYTEQVGHGTTNIPLMYATKYQLQLGEHPCLKMA